MDRSDAQVGFAAGLDEAEGEEPPWVREYSRDPFSRLNGRDTRLDPHRTVHIASWADRMVNGLTVTWIF